MQDFVHRNIRFKGLHPVVAARNEGQDPSKGGAGCKSLQKARVWGRLLVHVGSTVSDLGIWGSQWLDAWLFRL